MNQFYLAKKLEKVLALNQYMIGKIILKSNGLINAKYYK